MPSPDIFVSLLDSPLPSNGLTKPFAVLLDTRDREWADAGFLVQKVAELLEMGCRYYVCFGPGSELVHDQVDDVVLDKLLDESVVTTFHDDETMTDVANFFKVVAMQGMNKGVLLVDKDKEWLAEL